MGMNSEGYARLLTERARAEIELLAAVAASPWRHSFAAARLGIRLDHFSSDGTRALWLGLGIRRRWSAQQRAFFCRHLLRACSCWSDSDCRPFLTGSPVWGPGSLSALFYAQPASVELVEAAAVKLLYSILILHKALREGVSYA